MPRTPAFYTLRSYSPDQDLPSSRGSLTPGRPSAPTTPSPEPPEPGPPADPFDPRYLAIAPEAPAPLDAAPDPGRTRSTSRAPRGIRFAPGTPFLRGPIPMGWWKRAAELPGKAVTLGLLLWFRAGVRDAMTIRLTHADLALLGVQRHAAYRALAALERAELVAVKRRPGCCHLVTLRLDALPARPPSRAFDADSRRSP